MNQSAILDSVYLPDDGRRKRGRKKRTSKLEAHRAYIEKWLLRRSESNNKGQFSQRLLAAKLEREYGINVSQSALSRFCEAQGWKGFFHE